MPGASIAGEVVKRYLQRRSDEARKILLDEFRRGNIDAASVAAEDDRVAVIYRYLRASWEGSARVNLHLLAKAIVGWIRTNTLVADEFLPHADALAALSRDEIILLAEMYQQRFEAAGKAVDRWPIQLRRWKAWAGPKTVCLQPRGALRSLQGAVLMAEHGLMSEAYTLVRSGLETVFYLGAAIRTDDINVKLPRDHVKRMGTAMDGFKRAAPEGDPSIDTDAFETMLRATLPEGVDPAKISMETFAKQAELSHLYDGLYRQLSLAHAHPSLVSVASIRPLSKDHKTGDPNGIKDALSLAFTAMFSLLVQWARLLVQNGQPETELHQRLLQIGQKYQGLLK